MLKRVKDTTKQKKRVRMYHQGNNNKKSSKQVTLLTPGL